MSSEGQDYDKVIARIHRMADTVQQHELRLAETKVRMDTIVEHMNRMASGEALAGAMLTFNEKLDHATEMMELKVGAIHEDLGAIKKGGLWFALIVIGIVVTAVVKLVVKP